MQVPIGIIIFALAQHVGAGDIVLKWDPITDFRISGYEVHYGTVSRQYSSMFIANVDGAATNTAIVSYLIPGTRYYFSVRSRSFDGSSVSAYSNEVSAIVPYDGTWEPVGFDKFW